MCSERDCDKVNACATVRGQGGARRAWSGVSEACALKAVLEHSLWDSFAPPTLRAKTDNESAWERGTGALICVERMSGARGVGGATVGVRGNVRALF